ncbi:hypothetical protein [Streptomyces sp. OE57]
MSLRTAPAASGRGGRSGRIRPLGGCPAVLPLSLGYIAFAVRAGAVTVT